MTKFSFPLGDRLQKVVDSIEFFFNTFHEKKENKIHFSEIPPKDPEPGDLWVSYAIDHKNLKEIEFPVSANIEKRKYTNVSLKISIDIDNRNETDSILTPTVSDDGNWVGYLQGVYGSLENTWFLTGDINWFAANTKGEIWFEGLGEYSDDVEYVVIDIDDTYSIRYDGLHDLLKREDGFYTDYVVSQEVADYLASKAGEEVKLHLTYYRF